MCVCRFLAKVFHWQPWLRHLYNRTVAAQDIAVLHRQVGSAWQHSARPSHCCQQHCTALHLWARLLAPPVPTIPPPQPTLVPRQGTNMASPEWPGWRKGFYLPTRSDAGVVVLRKWLDTVAGAHVAMRVGKGRRCWPACAHACVGPLSLLHALLAVLLGMSWTRAFDRFAALPRAADWQTLPTRRLPAPPPLPVPPPAGGGIAWGPNIRPGGAPIQAETRRELLFDHYHQHTGGWVGGWVGLLLVVSSAVLCTLRSGCLEGMSLSTAAPAGQLH